MVLVCRLAGALGVGRCNVPVLEANTTNEGVDRQQQQQLDVRAEYRPGNLPDWQILDVDQDEPSPVNRAQRGRDHHGQDQ